MPSSVLDFPDISVVYGRYAALTKLSADMGGSLLLYADLDTRGVAVAVASNVAGAASLGIEPGPARAKAALRAGVCDFVVNDLGESLRILKNEIRKRNGVSVVLTADPQAAVAEMVERGVQPEVLAFPMQEMEERGARMLPADSPAGILSVNWSVDRDPFKWLPVLDRLAVAALQSKDARVRWIEASPRYLGRTFARRRFVRMTGPEAESFVAAIHDKAKAREIPVIVTITCEGKSISIQP